MVINIILLWFVVSFNCIIKYQLLVKQYSTSHNYIINFDGFCWLLAIHWINSARQLVVKTWSHLLYFLAFTVIRYFSYWLFVTSIYTLLSGHCTQNTKIRSLLADDLISKQWKYVQTENLTFYNVCRVDEYLFILETAIVKVLVN